jgi:hypothetical protein
MVVSGTIAFTCVHVPEKRKERNTAAEYEIIRDMNSLSFDPASFQ